MSPAAERTQAGDDEGPRRRANISASGGEEGDRETAAAFATHAEEESDRRAAREDRTKRRFRSITVGKFLGQLVLYLFFPSLMGLIGLLTGYLSQKRDAAEGGDVKEIDIDRDFIFPFLLTLVMVIVVGFQTGGFKTREVKPVVSWPKLRRKRRIVRKVVVVDDDGNEVEQDEGDVDDNEVDNDDRAALEEWKEEDEKQQRGRGTLKED